MFEPVQISNCILWYDLQDSNSLTLTGSLIDQINDKSGEDDHATASGAARPTYNATGLNSLPTIEFNDTHQLDFAQLATMSTEQTVFCVLESDQDASANSIGNIIGINTESGSPLPLIYLKDDSDKLNFSWPSLDALTFTTTQGLGDGEPVVGYCKANSSPQSAEAGISNGELGLLTKTGTPALAGNGGTSQLGDSTKGKLSELIVYNRELTSDEINKVLRYLGSRWNIFVPNKILNESQKLSADRVVKLYELDTTALGGSVFRFVSSVDASNAISSLTSSGLTATAVTVNPHTLATSDSVRISGVNQDGYNGDYTATVVDANTFTFTLAETQESPASGLDMRVNRLNNFMVFDGNDYTPIAFEAEGFQWNGRGSLPTPTIRISNVLKVLQPTVIGNNDIVGAKFTRIRTFRKHLDDGSDPDTTAIFPKEIYSINRKSKQNKIFIEFELAASLDQEGAKIPARQCLKKTCTHRYRTWTGSAFDYTNATCPYTGSTYFNNKDESTADPAEDQCAKQLNSCKLRFGSAPLPTRAFPGIGI